jgi:hypothetical protein
MPLFKILGVATLIAFVIGSLASLSGNSYKPATTVSRSSETAYGYGKMPEDYGKALAAQHFMRFSCSQEDRLDLVQSRTTDLVWAIISQAKDRARLLGDRIPQKHSFPRKLQDEISNAQRDARSTLVSHHNDLLDCDREYLNAYVAQLKSRYNISQ